MMLHYLSIPKMRVKVSPWLIVLACAYLLVLQYALTHYLAWQSVNIILGLIAIPVVSVTKRNEQGATRYAWAGIIMGVLSIWLPVSTLLYFTIVFAAFYIAESFAGKINLLPLMVAVLMSPVVQYISNVFSFPIRMELTEWAGGLIGLTGVETSVHGNMIVCNNNEFAVDPACMGLNMMITSQLLQLILIAIYQKRYGKRASWMQVLLLMAFVFSLNIFSNLFRIVMLVWFNILPGTAMHDVVGILCLVCYVIIPSLYITRVFIRRFAKSLVRELHEMPYSRYWRLLHLPLLAITCIAAFNVHKNQDEIAIANNLPVINGYKAEQLQHGIVKLQNDETLIYIKGIPGFYSSEHNPMICWRGSGYEFRHIIQENIGTMVVYTAVLQKEKSQLYTAWWYDNGDKCTIEQLDWRWDVLTGGNNYSVVNVSANTKESLMKTAGKLIYEKQLNPYTKPGP
jgi:exosortase N